MRDIMIDLETWGQWSGCAIRSIGAVMFDPYSDRLGEEFYVNVSRESCENLGLFVADDTAKWWDKQSHDAKSVLEKDQIGLGVALVRLNQFAKSKGAAYPWSQGANFDQPIIEHAYRVCRMNPPWKFWDSNCTRTIYRAAGCKTWDFPKNTGTPHYALDDARHQARCVQISYKKLGLHK